MRGKIVAVIFAFAAMSGLTHCVDDPPAPVTETPTEEAGTGAETDGGTEASTSSDASSGSDTATSNEAGDDAGSTPKQAFVTDGTFRGDMSVLGGGPPGGAVAAADQHCMEAAAGAFPGRTFHALLAGTGVNAFTHVGAGPWYVGVNFLGGIPELSGGNDPKTPLVVTQSGAVLGTSASAWTGAKSDGTVDPTASCANWSNATDTFTGIAGTVAGTGGFWLAAGDAICNIPRHLYCFEQ